MLDTNLIIIGTVALSSVITQLLNVYRERRNRKWDIEDRAAKAGVVASALATQADRLAHTTNTQAAVVLHEIQKNTEISKAAFNEANDTNAKIAQVHARIDAIVKDVNAALNKET